MIRRWCILMGLIVLLMPEMADAQRSNAKKQKSKKEVPARKREVPLAVGVGKDYTGNSHIYYPDYYAFYDPNRGYVYWNVQTNSWTTSQQVPAFMSNVDMRRTRVQILKGLSLDLYPERNYPNYMKLYPAKLDNPSVPVPNHRQGHRQ